MKNTRWFVSILASIPVVAAVLALQSCGGVGGPTAANGGQGSVSEQFLALLSDEQRAAKEIGPQQCAGCHGGETGDVTYAHWKDTTHFTKGVTCEKCHGPGSAHKANPTKTNILTFPKSTDPVVCGQCHGPTHDQYNFSQHSKLIVDPVEEATIDPERYGRTSRCIACHSGLFRAQVVEGGVDIATMDVEEIKSIAEATLTDIPHTSDCVTCHNPHKKTGNLNAEGEEVQLRHKVFNTDTTQVGPGTTPDQFTTFDHICAQCHNGRGTNPSDARLTASTSRPSMHDSNQFQMLMGFGAVEGTGPVQRNTAHANAPGQCIKCHMPDARHTFTVSFDKGCAPCHTAADAAARADTIKSEILAGLTALRVRMENWAQATFGDPMNWDYTSLITAEGGTPPDQALVPIEVKRARHNFYFVVRSGDYGVHNAPYAKHLINVANQNLTAIGARQAAPKSMSKDAMLQLIESDRKRASRIDATMPE